MFIIDIETVAQYPHWGAVPEQVKKLFLQRFRHEVAWEEGGLNIMIDDFYRLKGALHAEFGKIVSIAIGILTKEQLRVMTLCGSNERLILEKAYEVIKFTEREENEPNARKHILAHNGLEFDFPFMSRRYMIHKLGIPKRLDVYKVKTWEQLLDDTMKLWSGSAWNYKISFELLCHCLGVESPKGEMTGADVHDIYYSMFNENGDINVMKETEALGKIAKYNQGDVVALAHCVRELTGAGPIKEIIYV